MGASAQHVPGQNRDGKNSGGTNAPREAGPHASGAHGQSDEAHPVTDGCRFCWMCRHVCPVGHVTHNETLTPHGWALTIDAVARGTLQWTADTADVLYSCADCGLCRTHCVTDQPLPDAIVAARAEVAARGTAPDAVYALHEKLERWGNPYESPLAQDDRSAAGAAPAGRQARRDAADAPVPTTAASTAASRPRPHAQRESDGGDTPQDGAPARNDVALFVGDAATHLDPKGLEAAIALLKAAGIAAVPIGVGRSSGLLASTLGFPDTAAEHAKVVLAEVAEAGCRRLLVLTAGDRFAFERVYRDRLGLEWPADVEIADVTTVLADALAKGRLALRRREEAPAYAYQDPDHAPRIGRDHAAPRALLRAALGDREVRPFWREQRAHPSGAVGGLDLIQPEIAAALSDARLADAAAAGASWLIVDDPAAAHHLRSRQSSTAGAVEVHGFYELLAAQLAG